MRGEAVRKDGVKLCLQEYGTMRNECACRVESRSSGIAWDYCGAVHEVTIRGRV